MIAPVVFSVTLLLAGLFISSALRLFWIAAGHRSKTLCRFAVDWARRQGFASMQFNAVVEANSSAVSLYEREGFRVIGTVPRSFEHPAHGRVGLHVMYQEFTDPA